MRSPRFRTLLLALLAVASLTAFTGGGGATTYTPPFEPGPSEGDQYNMLMAEPEGRVTVARANPHPGGISCPAGAGYAKLQVAHVPTGSVESVAVSFTEGAVDPYTFAVAAVRDANGTFIGSHQVRGPITADGALEMPVEWPDDDDDAFDLSEITVEFGLQLSGACPSVDGGTLRFTEVAVTETHHD